jgi:hypothetical protein
MQRGIELKNPLKKSGRAIFHFLKITYLINDIKTII